MKMEHPINSPSRLGNNGSTKPLGFFSYSVLRPGEWLGITSVLSCFLNSLISKDRIFCLKPDASSGLNHCLPNWESKYNQPPRKTFQYEIKSSKHSLKFYRPIHNVLSNRYQVLSFTLRQGYILSKKWLLLAT